MPGRLVVAGTRLRSSVFRKTIKRMRCLRRGISDCALKFEMAKWQLKRAGHRIIPHPVVRHLGPAACRQTNVRPVEVRQKRTVSAGVPAKNVQITADRAWRQPVHLRSGSFAGGELSEVGGGVNIQAPLWPSSKRRTLRISGSIFSLRKLGACSGHCTVQRMALTRLVSWARYHAAIPISTHKSQQRAATTYGLLTTRLRARLRRGELTSDF